MSVLVIMAHVLMNVSTLKVAITVSVLLDIKTHGSESRGQGRSS